MCATDIREPRQCGSVTVFLRNPRNSGVECPISVTGPAQRGTYPVQQAAPERASCAHNVEFCRSPGRTPSGRAGEFTEKVRQQSAE